MCDYYEFSDKLFNFLYHQIVKLPKKQHIFNRKDCSVLYNIEIHGSSNIELIIFTSNDVLFDCIKNKLINNETELRIILKKQLFISNTAKIIYTHAYNIDLFEEDRNRNAEIDYIVKYYV